MIVDPSELISIRQQDLLAEADSERLADQLPPHAIAWRHALALACYRLAGWLDEPGRYLRSADSGADDWVIPLGCV